MSTSETVVIGTRGSALALWQARHVAARLADARPGIEVRLEVIRTRGDTIQGAPLAQVGGKGLFTKEIEDALLDGRVDLAVHSIKDLPTDLPEGLALGAIPEREAPWDCLVSRTGARLADLAAGATVGTSSLRRRAQLRAARPDLGIVDLRGNVDTRLRKVADGQVDAAVLALAGIRRLGREGEVTEVLDPGTLLPAVGQGALGVEIRAADTRIGALVGTLHHPDTARAVEAERAVLGALEGGCQVPLAAHATDLGDGRIRLVALVASPEGAEVLRASAEGAPADAVRRVVARLEDQGARDLLARVRASAPPPVAPGGGDG